MADAPGEITVVFCDARLSLELELERGENQEFDLLVLDAFANDYIPVHLITREVFVLYLQHLKPDGILAVDITNMHLNLQPVVVTVAQEFNMAYAIIRHEGDEVKSSYSLWAIISRDRAFIESASINEHSLALEGVPEEFRLWTDDYSNLFNILK